MCLLGMFCYFNIFCFIFYWSLALHLFSTFWFQYLVCLAMFLDCPLPIQYGGWLIYLRVMGLRRECENVGLLFSIGGGGGGGSPRGGGVFFFF